MKRVMAASLGHFIFSFRRGFAHTVTSLLIGSYGWLSVTNFLPQSFSYLCAPLIVLSEDADLVLEASWFPSLVEPLSRPGSCLDAGNSAVAAFRILQHQRCTLGRWTHHPPDKMTSVLVWCLWASLSVPTFGALPAREDTAEIVVQNADETTDTAVAATAGDEAIEYTLFNDIRVPQMKDIEGEAFNETIKDGYW